MFLRLFLCLNFFLGVVNDFVENVIELEIDVECGFFGKVIVDFNILFGEFVEGYDEVIFLVERWKVLVGGNDLKVFFGSL